MAIVAPYKDGYEIRAMVKLRYADLRLAPGQTREKSDSSGKCVLCLVNGHNPELEKFLFSVAIRHVFERFDLVVWAFESTG